jgi:hypothetical protein
MISTAADTDLLLEKNAVQWPIESVW